MQQERDATPKPPDLVALRRPLESLFITIKESAEVPDSHTFDVASVDCADEALRARSGVAAFTLRKIQALRYVATPGVLTKHSVIVLLAADLNISLTELAAEALSRGHVAACDEMKRCQYEINRVSRIIAGLNPPDGGELT